MDKLHDIRKLIFKFGGTDGAHHKQWLIDQILRETFLYIEEYDEWVKEYENGKYGPKTYEWDVGLAP